MAISTLNDIKQGLIINYDGKPWQVLSASFMRTSQRKPVMQTKLKNLVTGKVLETSFKPGDRIEEADVHKKAAQYLYTDNTQIHLMDQESFEQIALEKNAAEEKLKFLNEGQAVDVVYWQDHALTIVLPIKIDLKVTEAPPGIKGDSAQGRVTKQATLENNLKINVPLFVKEGDTIRINTDTGEYVERV